LSVSKTNKKKPEHCKQDKLFRFAKLLFRTHFFGPTRFARENYEKYVRNVQNPQNTKVRA